MILDWGYGVNEVSVYPGPSLFAFQSVANATATPAPTTIDRGVRRRRGIPAEYLPPEPTPVQVPVTPEPVEEVDEVAAEAPPVPVLAETLSRTVARTPSKPAPSMPLPKLATIIDVPRRTNDDDLIVMLSDEIDRELRKEIMDELSAIHREITDGLRALAKRKRGTNVR